MTKKSLNEMTMNEAIKTIKEAMEEVMETPERLRFIVTCKNCAISISINGTHKRNESIEVALFTVDGNNFFSLDFDGIIEDRPIIYSLPLIAFPAFIKQFNNLEAEDFAEVWDAWDTIAAYS